MARKGTEGLKAIEREGQNEYHRYPGMLGFIKREMVFVIAVLAALVSAFFNPPSSSWIEAIDFRTLSLLFSLMGVSEGLKASGFFDSVAGALMRRSEDTARLSFLLVAIVFLSSMLFTNDVSLIMFVPFSMMLLDRERADESYMIKLIVLETIAANLGSMTTPVGNPQNLYICSFFGVSAGDFFRTILPYSVASALLILISFRLFLWKRGDVEKETRKVRRMDKHRTAIYLAFLFLAMLSVFRVISWLVLFIAELAFMLAFDRKILRRIDYILLMTFVAFFIFSENMRNIEGVRKLIESPMATHPISTSALVSQVISNVPAAILLSSFTDSFRGVLIGTDIGGLGTPIASLASLISLKLYFRRRQSSKGRYIMLFLILNVALLAILALFSLIIG